MALSPGFCEETLPSTTLNVRCNICFFARVSILHITHIFHAYMSKLKSVEYLSSKLIKLYYTSIVLF